MRWNRSIITRLLQFSLWYGWILFFCNGSGFFMVQEEEGKALVSWSFFWKNLKNFGLPSSSPTTTKFNSSRLVSNGLEIIILGPLKEELVFRGFLYHIVLNRMESTLLSGAIANGLFGLIHLINLNKSSTDSSSNSTRLYTFFQVFLSLLIGFFYTIRQAKDKKPMLENIFLHMQHNFFATFYTKEYSSLWIQDTGVRKLLIVSCKYFVYYR
jgi:membrane protease YdiL (CAAX protease family)